MLERLETLVTEIQGEFFKEFSVRGTGFAL